MMACCYLLDACARVMAAALLDFASRGSLDTRRCHERLKLNEGERVHYAHARAGLLRSGALVPSSRLGDMYDVWVWVWRLSGEKVVGIR